jgi:hypothetical protein
VSGAERNIITGNNIYAAESTGVSMAFGCRYNTFAGNFIYEAAGSYSADSAAMQEYVGCTGNSWIGNKVHATYRSAIYVGPACQSGHIIGNALIGCRVGVNMESDWIDGMSGASTTLTRENTNKTDGFAWRALSSYQIRNNAIEATSSCFHLSSVDNAWGETGQVNSGHIIAQNSAVGIDKIMTTYYDTAPGVYQNAFTDFDVNTTPESLSTGSYSLTGKRGTFQGNASTNHTNLRNVPGLADTVLRSFSDADATPSVYGGAWWQTANTGATSITDFDDGTEGEIIYVRIDTNTTIVHTGGQIQNTSGANITGDSNMILCYRYINGTWVQVTS